MRDEAVYNVAARRLLCSRSKLEKMFAILVTPHGEFLIERRFAEIVQLSPAPQPTAEPSPIITPEQFFSQEG